MSTNLKHVHCMCKFMSTVLRVNFENTEEFSKIALLFVIKLESGT